MTDGVASGSPVGVRRFAVELVGLPGAGKSRLARTLAQGLADRGVAVTQPQLPFSVAVPAPRRLLRKSVACAAEAMLAPPLTARLIWSVLHSGQEGGAWMARAIQLVVARHVARAAAPGGVSLVDEGIVQALWSVGLRGDPSPVLSALHDQHELQADLLVVLRPSPELALARLTARSSRHSRVQSLPERSRLAELTRGAVLLDELVAWWTERPGGSGELVVLSRPEEEDGEAREELLSRICAAVTGS